MIKIPVTMTPHVQGGKPTGYYLLAQRLFVRKVELLRTQFVGYSDGLILTVGGIEHRQWTTLLSMAVMLPLLDGKPISWLSPVAQYKSAGGFRTYLPGSVILQPTSAEEPPTHLYGEFSSCAVGESTLYYLRVPLLNGDVLLGRKKLHDLEPL